MEENEIDFSIEDELREEISQAKPKSIFDSIPKNYIYIAAGILGVIVLAIIIFALLPKNVDVTFSFYLNKQPVNENLDVTVSYGDAVQDYTTEKNKLSLSLPEGDVNLNIKTEGYQLNKLFTITSDQESYRVDIKKEISPINLEPEKESIVKLSVYKSTDLINTYNSAVSLNIKCLNSGKQSVLSVLGSSSYTKTPDCGSILISVNSLTGFNNYSSPCSDLVCKVVLIESSTPKPQLKNNDLVVKVLDKKNNSPVKDANITVKKENYIKMQKSDLSGISNFLDLELGTYTVIADVNYNNSSYTQLDSNVVVSEGIMANSKIFYFNFIDGNYLSLIIDTNKQCDFYVSVYDHNSKLVYDDSDVVSKIESKIGDLNSGNYYLNILPLAKCSYDYAPIYNYNFNYPEKNQITLKLTELKKSEYLLLTIFAKFNGAKVNNTKITIIDKSNNSIFGSFVTDGSIDDLILPINKNYILVAENKSMSGKLEYSSEVKESMLNDKNYYSDSITIPLKIDGATVNFNVNFDDDANTDFKITAIWKDFETDDFLDFDFDGNKGKKSVQVPAGTSVWFKVYKNRVFESMPGLPSYESLLNYYLNEMVFEKDSNVNIDVVVNNAMIQELIIKPKSFGNWYYNEYLNNVVKDNNFYTNSYYYAGFEVAGKYISNNSCIGDSKSGTGLVFLTKPENPLIIDINDIFAYSLEDMNHATLGFDFKSIFVESAVKEFQVDIYRVVVKAKTGDQNVNDNIGYLEYDVDYNYPKDTTKIFNANKKISKIKKLDGSVQKPVIINVNLFTNDATEGVIELPFDKSVLELMLNDKYIVKNSVWYSKSESVNCDQYISKLDKLFELLDLKNTFNNEYVTSEGLVKDKLNVNKDALRPMLDLPSSIDLWLEFDITLEGYENVYKNHQKIPVTINISRGDKPLNDCLEAIFNNTILPLKYIKNNSQMATYNNYDVISQLDLNESLLTPEISDLISKQLNTLNIDSNIDNKLYLLYNLSYYLILKASSGYDVSYLSSSSNIKINDLIYNLDVSDGDDNLYFRNKCYGWDYNVGIYDNQSLNNIFIESKKDNLVSLSKTIVMKSGVANIFSMYSDATKDNLKPKLYSFYFVVSPQSIDFKYKLNNNFMGASKTGPALNYNFNSNPNSCNKAICSIYNIFDWLWADNKDYPKIINLNNDNYDNSNAPFTKFRFDDLFGSGNYNSGEYVYNSLEQAYDYNKELFQFINYYLPYYSGEFLTNKENIPDIKDLKYGVCKSSNSEYILKFDADKPVLECGDLNTFKKVKMVKGKNNSDWSNALSYSFNNENIDLTTLNGFYYKSCNSSNYKDCILDSDPLKVITNKSDKNVYYFVDYGGHIYLPGQFFIISGNSLINKIGNVNLIVISPGNNAKLKNGSDFTFCDKIDCFNLTKLVEYYNAEYIKLNLNNKLYNWDFYNIYLRLSSFNVLYNFLNFDFEFVPQNTIIPFLIVSQDYSTDYSDCITLKYNSIALYEDKMIETIDPIITINLIKKNSINCNDSYVRVTNNSGQNTYTNSFNLNNLTNNIIEIRYFDGDLDKLQKKFNININFENINNAVFSNFANYKGVKKTNAEKILINYGDSNCIGTLCSFDQIKSKYSLRTIEEDKLCSKTPCSLFVQYDADKIYGLLDDNYSNLFSGYDGIGYYKIKLEKPLYQLEKVDDVVDDHIFYHMPIKTTNKYNTGICYYSSNEIKFNDARTIKNCDNNYYIDSYTTEMGGSEWVLMVDSSCFINKCESNADLEIYTYSKGVGICVADYKNYNKCINAGEDYSAYAIKNNNYYNVDDYFIFNSNSISVKYSDPNLKLVFIKPLLDVSNNKCDSVWQIYSSETLQDIIDNYNLGNIIYNYNTGSKDYIYAWDYNALIHNPYTC